ncbi:NAD-dependent epimerase/dehydratase family protein [Acidithiobacillus ferrooxidans]|uniref:NAD-dependent epimerase/dehydratase family protein n=1 Tax=Acidithiobacillus ferrooxidans TaxID=920 RepID=UPI001C079B8C|nr:NAD-dependent epimerase/dehydratase family protein [Acidithiobacillus ferrooxidans]MBU2855624.1 NAD-dependent epimerase/dehydratase family protein [Acidithiobacillus ferrooxidans]MBU2861742.1 NAD-dependent epimerase/dehydratase family protein [Acidithiobacillus ferrooxidans]
MRIVILGGDGFCGWPTSLYLSHRGHEVHILDNFIRRQQDRELGVESLTPIRPLEERLQVWQTLSGQRIGFTVMDIAKEYERLLDFLGRWRPQAVVHFAEQRSAPYSMKSSWHKRFTVDNNLNATHNVLCALVECGLEEHCHLVHLGTMGVYGYKTSRFQLPEGYQKVKLVSPDCEESEEMEILYPADPGSIYHLTKTQDQLFFYYYNKNDGLRITDLHQGVVWGTETAETQLDERLINRFDYDGDFGTVLNRFLMQAAVGHPLTVHGTGGQTRAFIHIRDTVRCIELAVDHPPAPGERVRVFNQTTETHRVRDLAQLIHTLTDIPVEFVDNPRNEQAENELRVANQGLRNLGLEPITLSAGLLEEIRGIARKYRGRCDPTKILCRSRWRRPPEPDA